MEKLTRKWLVRTPTGEVLGPFNSDELGLEMTKGRISPEDSIEPLPFDWLQAAYADPCGTITQTLSSITGHKLPETCRRSILAKNLTSPAVPDDRSYGTHPTVTRREVLGYRVAAILLTLFVLLIFFRHSERSARVSGAASQSPAVAEVEQALYRLMEDGQDEAALKEIQANQESLADGDSELLIPYAAIFIRRGEGWHLAARALDTVIASNAPPKVLARAHLWKGYLEQSRGNDAKAESQYLQSLAYDPELSAARYNLGKLLLQVPGKAVEALRHLSKLRVTTPDRWFVLVGKARALTALGRLKEAETELNRAVKLAPESRAVYGYLAIFQSMHRMRDPLEALTSILTSDPSFDFSTRAPLGFHHGAIPSAEYRELFDELMPRNHPLRAPGEAYLKFLGTGDSSASLGARRGADARSRLFSSVFSLHAALERAPIDLASLNGLLAEMPRELEAFGYYAYVLRAQAWDRLGNRERALVDIRAALELLPTSAVANHLHAQLLERAGLAASAKSVRKRMKELHPRYFPPPPQEAVGPTGEILDPAQLGSAISLSAVVDIASPRAWERPPRPSAAPSSNW